jgi:hypothetical protein
MRFEWRYHYVPEGQLEPDKFNRWRMDCYMIVPTSILPAGYGSIKDMIGDEARICIAYMFQKGCIPGNVPSTVDRFCVPMPTFVEPLNFGFSHQYNFFSNDIEELKSKVEANFKEIHNYFKNAL